MRPVINVILHHQGGNGIRLFAEGVAFEKGNLIRRVRKSRGGIDLLERARRQTTVAF